MDKIGQFLERGFFGGIVLAAAFAGAVYWHRPGKRRYQLWRPLYAAGSSGF